MRESQKLRKSKSKIPEVKEFVAPAIMVSVVSPQYVKSDYCLHELDEFCKSVEKEKGLWIQDKARVFKAVKTFVERDSQPDLLQQFADYEFFKFDPSGRPQEFWPELGSEANRNFWVKLEDIAYDIYMLMENIRLDKSDKKPNQSTVQRPTVYLSETTHDLIDYRDKIKRQLQQRGFMILPERPLPLNAAGLQTQVSECLRRSTVSIHLFGQSYGVVPDGETRSIPELQYEFSLNEAAQNGLSPLIWMPKNLEIQDERQQRLVDSLIRGSSQHKTVEVLQTSLDDFKTFLIDKLSKENSNKADDHALDSIQRIYLQCDKTDLDETAELEEYLFDQGFEIKLPAFEGDEFELFEAHKQNLLFCDATIIYYGNASDAWLNAKLTDLQKIAGYGRTSDMKAKLVYISAPETKHKQRFRTRETMLIKAFEKFNADLLKEFLDLTREPTR